MEYTYADIDTHRHTKRLIQFMLAERFLRSNHLCQRCMIPLRLERDKHWDTDKYGWRCPRMNCRQRCSVREGSFFSYSRMSLRTQLRIVVNFAADASALSTSRRARVTHGTVLSYFDRIRASYEAALVANPITFDFQYEYEVDELMIKGVRLPNVDHTHQRVAGILERQTGKVLYYRGDNRSQASLIHPIQLMVPQGSFVYSDDHRAYRILSLLGYFHHHVNHSAGEYARVDHEGFVDLQVHINTLEGVNLAVRARLRNRSRRTIERIDMVLAELMYRHSGRSLFDPIKL